MIEAYDSSTNDYINRSQRDWVTGLEFLAPTPNGPFARETFSETFWHENNWNTGELVRELGGPEFEISDYYDNEEAFKLASSRLNAPLKVGDSNEVRYFSPRLVEFFHPTFNGTPHGNQPFLAMGGRSIEKYSEEDSSTNLYDLSNETHLEWAFKLRSSGESAKWFKEDIILAGLARTEMPTQSGRIGDAIFEQTIWVGSSIGLRIAEGIRFGLEYISTDSNFPVEGGISYDIQHIRSQANDDKLLYAFPEFSSHIANLPDLPIFPVPEGADLLTGSYADDSSGNISWKGDGDEVFFAQGGSRIATGIGNDLTVITGYDFSGERNFLVDFDPANDRLMIAANSFQGLSDASPGKINTQTQSLFKYTSADQTLQYLQPQADSNGSDWLTIIQFNNGSNRAGFTFDPSTILIG